MDEQDWLNASTLGSNKKMSGNSVLEEDSTPRVEGSSWILWKIIHEESKYLLTSAYGDPAMW